MDRRKFITRMSQAAVATGVANTALVRTEANLPDGSLGPLRPHKQNGRYFAAPDGRAVLLTGAHTWNNLVDMHAPGEKHPFDFPAYLGFLNKYGHNFIRLWTWDSVTWDTHANRGLGKSFVHNVAPHPWRRTGPGTALDGKPKFNLRQFDADYFERLGKRVSLARQQGIYVSVMLFEGWGLMHGNRGRGGAPAGWAWRGHPFHPKNNINGVDAGIPGTPHAGRPHHLGDNTVNAIQRAYIRKVIDTVNGFDNVLFEVINEGGEQAWDWWVVQTIRDYEKTKPLQHPIGITGHGAEYLKSMLASPADWISPGSRDGFRDDPPAWDGKKVSLLDTDHVWGIGGNLPWAWKAFCRGHNMLFMDPYDGYVIGKPFEPRWEPLRRAMGAARKLSEKLDLASMAPHAELASTKYCLADPGKEYVVFVPDGQSVKVDVGQARRPMAVKWIHAASGESTGSSRQVPSGRTLEIPSPSKNPAVLHLRRAS